MYSDPVGWHATQKYSDVIFHCQKHGLGKGGVRAIFSGEWVDPVTFREVMLRAQADDKLPNISASNKINDGDSLQ